MNIKYFLGLLFTLSNFAHADLFGKVIKVSDGDTITILTGDKKPVRIRLENIDTPEHGQPYGTQARNFTNTLVYSKFVKVHSSGQDQYGRTLGTIYLNDQNVNKAIVQNGYAWAYRRYLQDSSYISLENDAKSHKRGLWRDKNPIEPSQWRHN